MRKGIIYRATLRYDGRSYFGQTIQQLESRKKQHLRGAAKGSKYYFHRALNLYGPDAFEWSIIEECFQNELNDRESFFIQQNKTTDHSFGFNLMSHGKQAMMSDETRKKIQEAAKRRRYSVETRLQYSLSRRGKKKTNQTRARMSETAKTKRWMINRATGTLTRVHFDEVEKFLVSGWELGKK